MKIFTVILGVCGMLFFGFNPKEDTSYTLLQQENKELKESMQRGAEVYKDFCLQCHMATGEGLKNVYPPLAKSDFIKKNRELSIKAIKYGLSEKITVNGNSYQTPMPDPGLYEEEVRDVANYIFNSWGNTAKMVTLEEVEAIEKKK